MHIFDYSYLKDSLLPAKLVNLTSNISALRILSSERRSRFTRAYSELERIAKIESVKASNDFLEFVSGMSNMHINSRLCKTFWRQNNVA